jgi:hypothetical protein
MSTRYDVLSPRKRSDAHKTYWHRVGTAFERERGGLSVVLDSLPLPDAEGQVRLLIVEGKARDEVPAQASVGSNVTPLPRRAAGGTAGGNDGDSIPFGSRTDPPIHGSPFGLPSYFWTHLPPASREEQMQKDDIKKPGAWPMQAPFTYFGGKRWVADVIWRALGGIENYIEPFAGSAAVLLARPGGARGIETINDIDGFVSNFWRAVAADPDAVARHAGWPVVERDLEARHYWLITQGRQRLDANLEDPDWFDAKIAGWWAWGASCWIGDAWCSGDGAWTWTPNTGWTKRAHRWIRRSVPHITHSGKGINRNIAAFSGGGHGVSRSMLRLSSGGQGVNRQLPHFSGGEKGVDRQIPRLADGGLGVNRKLLHFSGGGHGAHPQDAMLVEWMRALSYRLQRVRVTSGDWTRVVKRSVINAAAPGGIFLDPPYGAEERNQKYTHDRPGLAAKVCDWALENGADPALRIVLAGYRGEGHERLEAAGWRRYEWRANGGYANQSRGQGRINAGREALWMSPACLEIEADGQAEAA